jgi:hypothetical protein
MYQRSRKVLIFLVIVFLAIAIASTLIVAITTMQVSGGKLYIITHEIIKYMLIEKYQRNSFSPAPISAWFAMRAMPYL